MSISISGCSIQHDELVHLKSCDEEIKRPTLKAQQYNVKKWGVIKSPNCLKPAIQTDRPGSDINDKQVIHTAVIRPASHAWAECCCCALVSSTVTILVSCQLLRHTILTYGSAMRPPGVCQEENVCLCVCVSKHAYQSESAGGRKVGV